MQKAQHRTFKKSSIQGDNRCFWLSSQHRLLHRAGAHHLKVKESLIHGVGWLLLIVSLTHLKNKVSWKDDKYSVHL